MKKLIPILLALVMIVSVLASCNNTPAATTKDPAASGNNAQTSGNQQQQTTGNQDPGVQIPVEKQLNIDLDAIDYKDQEFYIYHWATSNPEFAVDEEAAIGDPIQEALYQRNLKVEEGLGIKLNFHAEDGHDNKQDNFVSKLTTRVQDPETPVDLIAAYSRTAPHVMAAGFSVDLLAYDDLDLSKVWWPSLVRETHEIKGRLFYTSGDASTGLLTQIETLFMNKGVFKGLGHDYEKFIKAVFAGNWTIDDLINYCTNCYQDLDDIKGESNGDMFGIIAENVGFGDGMWTAYGYTLFDISDEEDVIYTLSQDLLGDNALNFVKKLQDFSNTEYAHLQYEFASDVMPALDKLAAFSAGRTLFMEMRMIGFDASLVECDYTILPLPKGDEKQERYYTCVGNPYNLFSICSSSLDKELTARVLQTLGYYGYTYTTPAIFEVTFKGKVAKDDYAIELFDLIRENITFEIGRTFDRYTNTMLPNVVSRAWVNNTAWGTAMSALQQKMLSQNLANANKRILEVLALTE